MTNYNHTQKGPVHLILIVIAAVFLAAGIYANGPGWFAPLFIFLSLIIVFLGFCFRTLTVRDEGKYLAIRYGPLPVFRKQIPFDQVESVGAARSDWLDGGGIHYVPGRGWIYNLWGRDCVRLTLRDGVIRVGTDDPRGLLAFLNARLRTKPFSPNGEDGVSLST